VADRANEIEPLKLELLKIANHVDKRIVT